MTRGFGFTLLGIGLATVVAWWWFDTYEWGPREVDKPLRGEARYNDYFALRQALVAQGRTVSARGALDAELEELGRGDLLVLGTDVRTLGEREADALLGFIERGGHLAFDMPRGEQPGRAGPLLAALKLTPGDRTECIWGCEADRHRVVGHFFTLADDDDPSIEWRLGDDGKGHALVRAARGEGKWLAVGHPWFLTNRGLKHNPAFAWQVLAPMLGEGRVHIVYSTDVPPLYVLLLRDGWTVVLPLALGLLLWLWSRTGRVGPLLPVAPPRRRALLEHVNAAGELAWRRGRVQALHTAVRHSVLAHLRRIDPALAALEPAPMAQEISTRHGLPLEQVRAAMGMQVPATPQAFVTTIRTLMDIKGRKA